MNIVAYDHSPMLGRVRILANPLGDRLSDQRLSEPLATSSRYRMPAKLNGARLSADIGFACRNNIRFTAKSDRALQITLSFVILFLGFVEALFTTVLLR